MAGILGLAPDDVRVRDSFELARELGLDFEFVPSDAGTGLHPNTVTISMEGADDTRMSVTGESLGGGRVRISSIDGIAVEITGDYPTRAPGQAGRPCGAYERAFRRRREHRDHAHVPRAPRGPRLHRVRGGRRP